MEKEFRIEEVKLEIKKEFSCRKGCKSKVLVIHCIAEESESMDIELMKIKLWNGNHANHIYF